MNERSIHPINGVRAPEPYNKLNLFDKDESLNARENNTADAAKPTQKLELGDDPTNNLANISIHFNVDNETNHLVVVVTERKSGRVIRTIPASELEKMQAGDLLKLTA
jgi:uncharacterized FlaG/YvyC family protein